MKVIVGILGLAAAVVGWWNMDTATGVSCAVSIWLLWAGSYWLFGKVVLYGDHAPGVGAVLGVMCVGAVLAGLLYVILAGVQSLIVSLRYGGSLAEPSAAGILVLIPLGAITVLSGYLTRIASDVHEQSGV